MCAHCNRQAHINISYMDPERSTSKCEGAKHTDAHGNGACLFFIGHRKTHTNVYSHSNIHTHTHTDGIMVMDRRAQLVYLVAAV